MQLWMYSHSPLLMYICLFVWEDICMYRCLCMNLYMYMHICVDVCVNWYFWFSWFSCCIFDIFYRISRFSAVFITTIDFPSKFCPWGLTCVPNGPISTPNSPNFRYAFDAKFLQPCICMHAHACMHMHMHMHALQACICMHAYACTCINAYAGMHMHACICRHAYACMHMHACVCIFFLINQKRRGATFDTMQVLRLCCND